MKRKGNGLMIAVRVKLLGKKPSFEDVVAAVQPIAENI